MKVSCSTKVDFAYSGRVEAYGSALRESCSTTTGSVTCPMDCLAAGHFNCSS